MKRLILITTALFASFMFLEAQEINRGLQHHIDARSEATIETFIVGIDYTAGYRFNNFIFADLDQDTIRTSTLADIGRRKNRNSHLLRVR